MILAFTLAEWGAFLLIAVPLIGGQIVLIIKQVQAGRKQEELKKVQDETKKVVDFQTERMADQANIEVKKQEAAVNRGDRVVPAIAQDVRELADKLETGSVDLGCKKEEVKP